jgi:biotin operon repressor
MEARDKVVKALESNKKINTLIIKVMKKTETSKEKKKIVAARPKSPTVTAVLIILHTLMEGVSTEVELAKAAGTDRKNVAWYVEQLKNNGHKVEKSPTGYKLIK